MTKAELLTENNYLRSALTEQKRLTEEWKNRYHTSLDIKMLEARIKLASSVGQLVEATSKAVTFIVGKEVM